MMGDVLEKQFKERFGKVFTGFTHSEVKKGDITPALLQFVMAGDFMIPGAEPALV
jgi:dynein heavy chain